MQLSGVTLPGYRVYEYQLVLNPHEDLRNRLQQVKKEFWEKYKGEYSSDNFIGGKPSVMLVNFLQYEMMEEKIINRLKTIAMGFHPFKVELKDFGSFPSHTIYIGVTSKLPIQNLVKQVRTDAQRLLKMNNENKPLFVLEPHITLAAKLKPWQYEKGWLEYSHRHFTGRFIADGMTLLRRNVGEMRYHPVMRFDFQNLPVTTKQGDLFG